MEQKTITKEELRLEREKEINDLMSLSFEERLEKTVKKMIRIVRADTGASRVYADMLLSMFPNSTYKVCINHWCYKSDSDDEKVMLELMQNWNNGNNDKSAKWLYEKIARPYAEELEDFVKDK